MRLVLFLLLGFLTTTMISCESKAEGFIKKAESLNEQYINDLNNAETLEEAKFLREQYQEKAKYEESKLSEEEKNEFLRNASLDDIRRSKQSQEKVKEAERAVRERLRK